MDERTKELIAIGTSIGAHCQPCLAYHVEKAREFGANDEDICAAIEIGHMVEKGAISAMKKFSASILNNDQTSVCGCNGIGLDVPDICRG